MEVDSIYSAIQPILLVLLGSGITVIGTCISNKHSDNQLKFRIKVEDVRERTRLTIARFEELFTSISHYFNSLSSSYFIYYPLFKEEIDYNTALDHISLNKTDDTKYDYPRIDLLLRLYFPDLLEDFLKVRIYSDKMNNIISIHKREHKNGIVSGFKYVDKFNEYHQALNKAADDFIVKMIKLIRKTYLDNEQEI